MWVESQIDEITGLTVNEISSFQPRRPFDGAKLPPYRMRINCGNDLTLDFDAPQELADMIEAVWAAFEYGGEGDDEEQTLADLRAVMAARKARWVVRGRV